MREIGKMTRQMAMEFTSTPTMLVTRVSGKTISNMEKAKNLGQMVLSTKVNIVREKSMAKVSCDLVTDPNMKATSSLMISTGMVSTSGLMEKDTKENGTEIKCMAKEKSPGRMAENMKVTISMIKSTDMEYLNGMTEEGMKAIGKMVNNTEEGYI